MANRSYKKQKFGSLFYEISAQVSDETCLLFCYELCFVVAFLVTLIWKWCNEGAFRSTLKQLNALFTLLKNNWKTILLATLQVIVVLVLAYIYMDWKMLLTATLQIIVVLLLVYIYND